MRVLVVGAGFAGAVYARYLAEHGHYVSVIDSRDHIGGNAYDYVDQTGVRIHKYGPHLFHTSNDGVVAWLKRFGEFVPYEHSVTVLKQSKFLPMPINRATFEVYYERKFNTDQDLAAFLKTITVENESPRNAAEYLHSVIGVELTDIMFRPYTKKMWGRDLDDMDSAIVRRISIQLGYEHRYFPKDAFQLLPRDGYEAIFRSIFDHKNIEVSLRTHYDRIMSEEFSHTFSSAAIDEHFGYEFGELPYRSIIFHNHRVSEQDACVPTSVVNYSDDSAFTRETRWHMLPRHHVFESGVTIKTIEEPCDFRSNNRERYYPISDAAGNNRQRYVQYKAAADKEADLTFIGRCGSYQYLDMHQVINQSMSGVQHWLATRGFDRSARISLP